MREVFLFILSQKAEYGTHFNLFSLMMSTSSLTFSLIASPRISNEPLKSGIILSKTKYFIFENLSIFYRKNSRCSPDSIFALEMSSVLRDLFFINTNCSTFPSKFEMWMFLSLSTLTLHFSPMNAWHMSKKHFGWKNSHPVASNSFSYLQSFSKWLRILP